MQDRNQIKDGYLLTTGSDAKLYKCRDGELTLITDDPQMAVSMWHRTREIDDRRN